jgi:sialate O-acetylesterase
MLRNFAFTLGCLICSIAQADVVPNKLFSDNLVLQRSTSVAVWGTADAGEAVTVSIAGQEKKTKAGKDGKWMLRLDPLKAGGPFELTIAGKNKVTAKDVLVGEVWLCSGQSNMAMTVSRSLNAEKEIAAGKHPQIRMFKVSNRGAKTPQTLVQGQWSVCTPKTVGAFSATGYFFGRALHEELDVPIGLINSSVGGTPVEAWTSIPRQQEMFASPEVAAWLKAHNITNAGPKRGELYNGKIAPLVPFGIRGAIWYQGEANRRGYPYLYRHRLPALVNSWRSDWKLGDFPFAWVQLPNFTAPHRAPVEDSGWVTVREGMAKTLALPNTGMAVTLDVGDARDIHPKNKQAVGKRLALWALGTAYDKKIVYSGPQYRSSEVKDGEVVVTFDHLGDGLTTNDDKPLRGFAIAGADKKWQTAAAKIVGETIIVSSPNVSNPVAVRYAWAANPNFNLYNTANLPAAPFRTDDWELPLSDPPAKKRTRKKKKKS